MAADVSGSTAIPQVDGPSAALPKPIRALVLDTAPFISHTVPPTSLLSRADKVYTTHAVLSEIRDGPARERLETLWRPFLITRDPRPESVRRIFEVARKTGDKEVLSGADLGILALAWELECELRGGGDGWMRVNKIEGKKGDGSEKGEGKEVGVDGVIEGVQGMELACGKEEVEEKEKAEDRAADMKLQSDDDDTESQASEGDGEGEWITPSNIHKFRGEAELVALTAQSQDGPIYAACATSDFAMQNVLLQLPIPLISPASPYMRIKTVKQWLLRCHACFFITRDMKHQFCPRCGGPTLLRTSCSVDSETGKITIYLKKNFQWNNRGNVYSIPKPTGGRASGKEGNGVRHELILRADQKEYLRKREENERRSKKGERDLMDGDYLPGLLTGERTWHCERIKIGHGRQNPNARRGGGGRKR